MTKENMQEIYWGGSIVIKIIESLRFLCHTRLDIAYGVGLISRFMETGDSCNISFSMSKEESKQPETRGVSV